MNAQDLMAKAQRALASAHTLLADGDNDGACNRADYAMFDAAPAALIASNAPVPPEVAKSHSGLIAAFSLHLVKTGRLPLDLGRSLNKVEDLRLVADYKGDPIDTAQAQSALAQSQHFVSRVAATFFAAQASIDPQP